MTIRSLLSVLSLLALCCGAQAQADRCDALRPNQPRDVSQETVGKIDAKVDGFAKRLLSGGASLDGSYKEASKDVLKDYPNADRLYLWDRLIYLTCISVLQSSLPDREKLDRINELIKEATRRPPGITMTPCVPGAPLMPASDTFHLYFRAIEESANLETILRNQAGKPAERIMAAVRAGTLQPLAGEADLTVRISGVMSDAVPEQIPYLAGENVCVRMIGLTRMADGVLQAAFPISGKRMGQAVIVLPRRILETSPRAQLCVQPTFVLSKYNATEIRQNMYCGNSGTHAGTTRLYENVLRGNSSLTILIRQRAAALHPPQITGASGLHEPS